jgi:phosphoribosyl 1,2-cyclic phosphodiesterase
MKLCPLFSSSSGNCAYIGGANGGVLVDAGVSAKRIGLALQRIGAQPSRIGAVFVTHEHGDHIAGLRVFCRRNHIPIFATNGTLRALEQMGALAPDMQTEAMPQGGVEVNGLLVRCFPTSHDVAEPCGFRLEAENGETFAVATDTGVLTEETKAALLGCDTVLLESNHEIAMVENGPYPYPTKRRILSDLGHLSNTANAAFLPQLLQSGTGRFTLAHLSRNNNTPELAYATAKAAFDAIGAKLGIDYELQVASNLL